MGLHQHVFFPLGPVGELFARDKELGGAVGLDGNAQLLGKTGQGVLGVILVRIEQVNLPDLILLDPLPENLPVALRPGPVRQAAVKNAVPGLLQSGGVMTHGGIKQGELLLMVAEVLRPWGGLDQAYREILRGRAK